MADDCVPPAADASAVAFALWPILQSRVIGARQRQWLIPY